ncbi:MAG: hypothetical protein HYZ81_26250, partial [Nitrospinae bacterium]|nr:hypothetical protein [Nitrospinota bacterium]
MAPHIRSHVQAMGGGLALWWRRQRQLVGESVQIIERRKAIQGIMATICVISVSGLLGRLRSLGEAAAATVTDLLQKIQGLPPEVTPVGKFYTISKNVFDPAVDAKMWHLQIKGLVEQPY